jgi:hypothetical protein
MPEFVMDEQSSSNGPTTESPDLSILAEGRVAIASDISSHTFENELLIFSEGNQTLYGLNHSASVVWRCCEDGMTLQEIAEVVSGTYGIAIEQARLDAQNLMRKWISLQLVDAGPVHRKSPMVEKIECESDIDSCLSGSYSTNEFPISFKFRLGGSAFLLRFSHEELKRRVAPIFMHLESPHDTLPMTIDIVGTDSRYLIIRENVLAAQCSRPEQIAPAVGYEVATAAYRNADFFIALHAAAVGLGGGCAVFPGKCGAGKTTLVAALIKAGFRCFGDEATILDRVTHRIIPLPMSLRVKEGSWQIVSSMFPEFSTLETHILKDGMRLRYLVPPKGSFAVNLETSGTVRYLIFPLYSPECETSISPLKRTEALQRLQQAGHAISEEWDRAKVADLLTWIKDVDCYEMPVSSLPKAVDLVRRLLG